MQWKSGENTWKMALLTMYCHVASIHRAHNLSLQYSSWSDNIRERYKAIGVRWIQRGRERDQDLVEVLDQFKPRPVDDE